MSEQLTSEQRASLGLEDKLEVGWVEEDLLPESRKSGFYSRKSGKRVDYLAPAYKTGMLVIKKTDKNNVTATQTWIEGFPNRTAKDIDFTHYHLGTAVSFRFRAEEEMNYVICPVSLFRQENPCSEHIDSEKDIPL